MSSQDTLGISTSTSHHAKRNSFDVHQLSNASQNVASILRSRPSSPAPGSPKIAVFDEDSNRSYGPSKRSIHDGYFGASASAAIGSSSKVHAPVPMKLHLPAQPHPLFASSTVSSGQTTPNFANYASDERSPLLSVEVDRPSTPGIQQREWQRMPHYDDDPDIPTFLATERGGVIKPPTLRSRLKVLWIQIVANAISTVALLLIIIWALCSRALRHISLTLRGAHQPRHPRAWDNPAKWEKEELVKDVKYYAASCGYEIQDQEVITPDGYKLRVHKVIAPSHRNRPRSDGRGGYPVVIQHGLFQSSGSFVTSEERSLAFWLAEQGGYQVYLGNNRGVFDMGHTSLSRSDPRFWDYNIRELALYDLPAIIEHVKKETGYDTVAFIGHSQGNATMFVSLARGMVPDLGHSLSCFIALAPAVYSGPLTHGFPFTAIKHMDWKSWKRIFGVLDFIPIMRWSYDYTPSLPFALLGYQMFAFLFEWTDANWLLRRKAKMFRFTPSPVPSAGIFWWTGLNGFSSRGCVLNPDVNKWYDKRFPPLALYHGGKDYLVLADKLIDRLRTNEPDVRLIRNLRLDDAEHCDFFWSVDAVEDSYVHILEDIEKTRPRYPEEQLGA